MVFERVLALTVALLVVMGASIMVMQRIYHDRWYYVSEFGAAGLETEEDFKVGFTMLACGILLAAWPLRTVTRTSSGRRLFVMPWMTVGLAGVCFFVASQVNCTESCPSLANPEAILRATSCTCGSRSRASSSAASRCRSWQPLARGVCVT